MKSETIILVALGAAVLYMALRKPPQQAVTIVQAPKRSALEQGLTGFGALLSGAGDAVSSVIRSIGPAGPVEATRASSGV